MIHPTKISTMIKAIIIYGTILSCFIISFQIIKREEKDEIKKKIVILAMLATAVIIFTLIFI